MGSYCHMEFVHTSLDVLPLHTGPRGRFLLHFPSQRYRARDSVRYAAGTDKGAI